MTKWMSNSRMRRKGYMDLDYDLVSDGRVLGIL